MKKLFYITSPLSAKYIAIKNRNPFKSFYPIKVTTGNAKMTTLALKKTTNFHYKISPEEDPQIISLYFSKENPMSLREISRYYKNRGIEISGQAISDHIKNQGYALRKGREAFFKGKALPSYDEVRERYVNREESARKITKECSGSLPMVYRMLERMGIKRREKGRKKIDIPKDITVEMHREHKSCYKIADCLVEKGYKACYATVRNRLVEWGEIKRPELEEKVQ